MTIEKEIVFETRVAIIQLILPSTVCNIGVTTFLIRMVRSFYYCHNEEENYSFHFLMYHSRWLGRKPNNCLSIGCQKLDLNASRQFLFLTTQHYSVENL